MKQRIILPDNVFSKIFLSEINSGVGFDFEFCPSSLISGKLINNPELVGLIPTMDLLTYKDLFVSSKIGISFNALLSNAYLHFEEQEKELNTILLKGDITANEIILSKILFKEFYDIDITPTLVKDESTELKGNCLITGDENFKKELFLNGLSFAEEIIELIDAPYINFILSSASDLELKKFTDVNINNLLPGHPENLSGILNEFTQTSLDFINVNIQHIVFDFEDQDLEGLKTLLQLPYYHGIVKDMVEIKYV